VTPGAGLCCSSSALKQTGLTTAIKDEQNSNRKKKNYRGRGTTPEAQATKYDHMCAGGKNKSSPGYNELTIATK
jgi:hypothetical protein